MEFETLFGKGNEQLLLCPCDGYIKEASSLFQPSFTQSSFMGEGIVFQSYKKYNRKFQSFAGMDCGKDGAVIVIGIICSVRIIQKGIGFKEVVKRTLSFQFSFI